MPGCRARRSPHFVRSGAATANNPLYKEGVYFALSRKPDSLFAGIENKGRALLALFREVDLNPILIENRRHFLLIAL